MQDVAAPSRRSGRRQSPVTPASIARLFIFPSPSTSKSMPLRSCFGRLHANTQYALDHPSAHLNSYPWPRILSLTGPYKASPLSRSVTRAGWCLTVFNTAKSDSYYPSIIRLGGPAIAKTRLYVALRWMESFSTSSVKQQWNSRRRACIMGPTKTIRPSKVSGSLGQVIGQLPTHQWDATQP